MWVNTVYMNSIRAIITVLMFFIGLVYWCVSWVSCRTLCPQILQLLLYSLYWLMCVMGLTYNCVSPKSCSCCCTHCTDWCVSRVSHTTVCPPNPAVVAVLTVLIDVCHGSHIQLCVPQILQLLLYSLYWLMCVMGLTYNCVSQNPAVVVLIVLIDVCHGSHVPLCVPRSRSCFCTHCTDVCHWSYNWCVMGLMYHCVSPDPAVVAVPHQSPWSQCGHCLTGGPTADAEAPPPHLAGHPADQRGGQQDLHLSGRLPRGWPEGRK